MAVEIIQETGYLKIVFSGTISDADLSKLDEISDDTTVRIIFESKVSAEAKIESIKETLASLSTRTGERLIADGIGKYDILDRKSVV